MLGSGQLDVHDRVGVGAAGLVGERAGGLRRGERVLVAMNDEKRRGAALGVVERRGGQRLAAGDPAVVAVEPYDRRYGRVSPFEPRLEVGVVRGEARQCRQAGAI